MKKYNVGILTEQFIDWGGGVDFIRLIISGLSSVNKEGSVKIKIYVLIPNNSNFKIKVKNFIKLIINLFLYKKYIFHKNIEREKIFEAFKDVNDQIIIRNYSNLKSSLEKLVIKHKINIIIPSFKPLSPKFPVPWVGYLYDFQHKYYPDFFSENEVLIRDNNFNIMLNQAKTIIVNSKTVKDDISKFIGTTNAKVFNLPFCPVLNLDFFKIDIDLSKFNLPNKYFMISNQFWKHKDHVTAIKGFKLFLDKQIYKDIGLVCTGQTHDSRFPYYFQEIKELITALNLDKNVYILGYLPKNEQLQILKNSIGIIQPTLFEGGPGGFAVYESVAFGIPSIVSDIEVNKELDDESVTFFKTSSPEDLAEKMIKVFEKPKNTYSIDELIFKNNKSLVKLGYEILSVFKNVFTK